MGTRRLMTRFSVAAVTAMLAGLLLATTAAAQGECNVTVEPSSVQAGSTYTVSGDFGGAEIYHVEGTDQSPPEDAEPDATTPQGSEFSVQFTAAAEDVGTWTVWAFIPASECGDSAPLTITAATIPNTASEPAPALPAMLGLLLVSLATVLVMRRVDARER